MSRRRIALPLSSQKVLRRGQRGKYNGRLVGHYHTQLTSVSKWSGGGKTSNFFCLFGGKNLLSGKLCCGIFFSFVESCGNHSDDGF